MKPKNPSRSTAGPMSPVFVTVVIRSFNRLNELGALVGIVLAQQYEPFEVLIVDSTPGVSDEALWEALGTRDLRVRLVRSPPRGCAAAANVGMREARGEVVAFVDDDDLPVGPHWLAVHARNYVDPLCLGVNGCLQYVGGGDERVPRIHGEWLQYQWMMSYGPFKKPRVFPGSLRRKQGIEWLAGGNASMRRSAWERGGGWDEYLRYHNEHSVFLRLAQRLSPGEHLVYEPDAKMLIRRDVPGGLDHRTTIDARARIDTLARYYLWLVARHHPLRIYGLFPIFVPYFIVDAGVHAAELAEHTREPLVARFVAGMAYAPLALARALVARRPPIGPQATG